METGTDEQVSEADAPTVTTGPEPAGSSTRQLEAQALVHRNVLWAFGAGILPVPMFDLVAITGVQLKMLKELSELYGVEFREGMAKKAVTSLLVGVGGVGIGGMLGASLFKLVPVFGYALGVASIPVVSGALTHAVGRAFIMHFESGGTMLDFDPKAMRTYFEQQFHEGKEAVAKMQARKPSAAPAPPAEPEAEPAE